MRGLKLAVMNQRQMMRMTMPGKHELMIRRAANHNTHVITPHGKIESGRKGRRG